MQSFHLLLKLTRRLGYLERGMWVSAPIQWELIQEMTFISSAIGDNSVFHLISRLDMILPRISNIQFTDWDIGNTLT